MKTLKKSLLLLLIVALIGIVGIYSPSQVVNAATITVTSTSGGTGGPDCTLRDAITAANTDTATGGCPAGSGADTIVLASGATYTLTEMDNVWEGPNGLPRITSRITIDGNGSIIERSSASGTPEFRMFYVWGNGDLTLDGLTIRNGYIPYGTSGDERGGGLVNHGMVEIINSTFSGNHANWGGGIANAWGTLFMDNSTVRGNHAYQGGGIAHAGYDMIAVIENSTISGNSAGAIGGGIYNLYGNLYLNNSTVSDNTAVDHSGGIYNGEGNAAAKLYNSTVSGNSAPIAGGIYNFSDSTVELTNTIVGAQLLGEDCFNEAVISHGYNLDSDGSCNLVASGDISNTDPHLDPLGDNGGPTKTHALLEGSPAIDAGNPTGCEDNIGPLITDQRGFPRFGNCDIGAYEKQPIAFSTKTTNQSSALKGDPLTYTIALTNGGDIELSNVQMTDTLPSTLTYIDDSLSATSGSYGFENGTVSWEGSVNASEVVTITFGTEINQQVELGSNIINSAVINGGGEVITRTASVKYGAYTYLPFTTRNNCRLLYLDNFSDPNSGWPVGNYENSYYEYRLDGTYLIQVRDIKWWAGARPGFTASDYILAVDLIPLMIEDATYGLIFGLSEDWSQFYTFEIDFDGNYGIFRYSNGNWTMLADGISGSIDPNNHFTRLKVKRDGALIEVYANGDLLASVSDGSYMGMRYVGLIVNSYDPGSASGLFDNFVVHRGTCNIDGAQNSPASRAPNMELLETGQFFSQPNSRKR